MRFLILGSSGQVGGALLEALNGATEEETIPFDLMRTPKEDLRVMSEGIEEAIAHADFVFFLAFDVGGSTYLAQFQDTFAFIHNNMRIMTNTFELLARHRKPFIFASSQMSTMSFSNYGLLKAIGERYSAALGGLTVKFWNVYGFESDRQKSHVITDFIAMANASGQIVMRTTGDELRQFLYSEDCAECLIALALQYSEVPRDKNLHITNFKWSSILDVARIVADMCPGTVIVPGTNRDTVQSGQKNEPDPFILNYWKPKTDLHRGIRQIARRMGIALCN